MPEIIIVTMPKTRWCRWTPLSLTTLPGHHGTLSLRISRVLILMKAKERMNPVRTKNRPCSSCSTSWFQKFEKIETELMSGPEPSVAAVPRRPFSAISRA